jgi:hypothetical protein
VDIRVDQWRQGLRRFKRGVESEAQLTQHLELRSKARCDHDLVRSHGVANAIEKSGDRIATIHFDDAGRDKRRKYIDRTRLDGHTGPGAQSAPGRQAIAIATSVETGKSGAPLHPGDFGCRLFLL